MCLQRLFGPATHRVREAQASQHLKGLFPGDEDLANSKQLAWDCEAAEAHSG